MIDPAKIEPGMRLIHPYSRTVTQADNLLLTLGSLNTAQVHFNVVAATQHLDGMFDERLVVGSCVLAIVTGLATAGWGSPFIVERGLTGLRFPAPTYPEDTLTATSEVLAVRRNGNGIQVETQLTATNQRLEQTLTVGRSIEIQPVVGVASR